MKEVNRLSMNPLECQQGAIAVSNHLGNTFDSVGCGRAVRYVCRSSACQPSDPPVRDDSPAFVAMVRRVAATHAALNAASIAQRCSTGGQPFGVRLLIRRDGSISEGTPGNARTDCVLEHAPALPTGPETLLLSHVFRP